MGVLVVSGMRIVQMGYICYASKARKTESVAEDARAEGSGTVRGGRDSLRDRREIRDH